MPPETHNALSALHEVARSAITHYLESGHFDEPNPNEFDPALRRIGASFVTLRLGGNLRGCIGTIDATKPLVIDTARNAVSAAFRDPRFSPVAEEDCPRVAIEISVLSPTIDLVVRSLEDLVNALECHVHGLVIAHGEHRATYLPSVWKSVPNNRAFVEQLRLKAGISSRVPPADWSIQTYTVIPVLAPAES